MFWNFSMSYWDMNLFFIIFEGHLRYPFSWEILFLHFWKKNLVFWWGRVMFSPFPLLSLSRIYIIRILGLLYRDSFLLSLLFPASVFLLCFLGDLLNFTFLSSEYFSWQPLSLNTRSSLWLSDYFFFIASFCWFMEAISSLKYLCWW